MRAKQTDSPTKRREILQKLDSIFTEKSGFTVVQKEGLVEGQKSATLVIYHAGKRAELQKTMEVGK